MQNIIKKIGIPKETKPGECRVSLIPEAVSKIKHSIPDVDICVVQGAGERAGYMDEDYFSAGAEILSSNEKVFKVCRDLIVKVKEPVWTDVDLIQKNTNIFSYVHAAYLEPHIAQKIKKMILESNVNFYAFELYEEKGSFPLLSPMSILAGEIAVEYSIEKYSQLSEGKLPQNVMVVGLGDAGKSAIKTLKRIGIENIIGFDIKKSACKETKQLFDIETSASAKGSEQFETTLRNADIVVGTVLVSGHLSPVVIDNSYYSENGKLQIFADVAIDQGGCLLRRNVSTTHAIPFEYLGQNKYRLAIPNLPAKKPSLASAMLSESIMPHVVKLINDPAKYTYTLVKTEDIA